MSDADTPHAFRGRHVLVLEDEPIIAIDIELELEDAGATVARAETLAEARDAAAARLPDAAVLDYSLMSNKNSESIAELLDGQGVPYVFYSGDLDRHGEAINRFGRPVVAKPAAAGDVLEALAKLLR